MKCNTISKLHGAVERYQLAEVLLPSEDRQKRLLSSGASPYRGALISRIECIERSFLGLVSLFFDPDFFFLMAIYFHLVISYASRYPLRLDNSTSSSKEHTKTPFINFALKTFLCIHQSTVRPDSARRIKFPYPLTPYKPALQKISEALRRSHIC